MNYRLLTADELSANLSFLDDEIKEKIDKHCGWLVIGQNDEKEIITVGAFVFDAVRKDTVELRYIYTKPEERENGWAMGMLYYAEKLFYNEGIRRFICCPTGMMDELMEFSGFLGMAGFEPVELDWHVYRYERGKLAGAKALQPYMEFDGKRFLKLSHSEIKYYLRSDDTKMPMRVRDNIMRDCDPDNSIFAVENGRIVAAVLARAENMAETNILNVYIYPAWNKKQQILAMLALLVKKLPKSVNYLNLAIDSENVRALYNYAFGNPDADYWVQCYERALDTEGRFSMQK